jgi:hypothetical protein
LRRTHSNVMVAAANPVVQADTTILPSATRLKLPSSLMDLMRALSCKMLAGTLSHAISQPLANTSSNSGSTAACSLRSSPFATRLAWTPGLRAK